MVKRKVSGKKSTLINILFYIKVCFTIKLSNLPNSGICKAACWININYQSEEYHVIVLKKGHLSHHHREESD
ncbi:unnamed protein product [Schistosoma curassoni]|nr:unnamed protein product [Schistosoma curassoni]